MGCEMAKLRRLDISLDNAMGIYNPGDLISGLVCVDVSDSTEVHGGRMWFYGSAETSWIEVTRSDGPETISGHQVFFQACCKLFGKDFDENDDGPCYTISPGFHQFPFKFQLPERLPSSFDYYSETGRIKARITFNVKAEVENAKRTASHNRERTILVVNYYDLNAYRHLIDRVCLKKEISLAYCCVSKGRIICELSLAKTGYVPGETMDISVHLFNSSSACVRSTHITFQQRVFLSAGCHRKTASALIFSISGQRVKPGASGYYHDVIHIPPLPPTGMPHCEIIDLEYVVQIQIEASGAFGQTQVLELSLPVIIGNVPLRESFMDNKQVVPCFAHFDFGTGDIIEHSPSELSTEAPRPVYTYYKTERRPLAGTDYGDGAGADSVVGVGGGSSSQASLDHGRQQLQQQQQQQQQRQQQQQQPRPVRAASSLDTNASSSMVAGGGVGGDGHGGVSGGRCSSRSSYGGRNGTITAI